MPRRQRGAAGGAVAPAPRSPAADAARATPAPRVGRNGTTGPRQGDLRSWGYHNAYHVQPRWEFPLGAGLGLGWNLLVRPWWYSHPPLAAQLAAGARHLELDVHVSDDAERVAVFHMARVDGRSTCTCLLACLAELRAWSAAHGRSHALVTVLLEPKGRFFLEDARARARRADPRGARRARAAATLRALDATCARASPMTPRSS